MAIDDEIIGEKLQYDINREGAGNKSCKIFDELSYERMIEMKDLSIQIDLNNSTYYFKDKSISPITLLVLRLH